MNRDSAVRVIMNYRLSGSLGFVKLIDGIDLPGMGSETAIVPEPLSPTPRDARPVYDGLYAPLPGRHAVSIAGRKPGFIGSLSKAHIS